MLIRVSLFTIGTLYPLSAILTRMIDFDAEAYLAEKFFLGVLCWILSIFLNTQEKSKKERFLMLSYLLLFVITYHSIYRCYTAEFQVSYVAMSFMIFFLTAVCFSNQVFLLAYVVLSLVGNFLSSVIALKSINFYQYFSAVFLSYLGIFIILSKRIRQANFLLLSQEEIEKYLLKTQEGIIVTDDELRIQYINEVAKKLINVGFQDELLAGAKILLPVSPLDQKLSNIVSIPLIGGIHIESKYIKAEWIGEPTFLIQLKDITSKLKQEQEAREKSILYEKVLKNAGEGILFLDTEGFVRYANPEALRLLELSEEELVGEFLLDKIHSTTAEGTSVEEENFPMRVTYTEGKPCHVTFDLFWRKDGSFFFSEYKADPVYNGEKLEGAIMIFRDVTKRKNKEDSDRRYADELLHLSNISTKFLEIYTEFELYRFIAKEISEMSEGSCVIVNSYDLISNQFKTVATAGFEKFQTEIYSLLGRDIKETFYSIEFTDPAFIYNAREEIEEVPEGLYSLSYGNWNHKLCIQIEQTTKTKKVYSIVLKHRETLLGNIILLHNKEFLEKKAMLEIFQNQASINLYRRLLDKNLAKEKFRFDPLFQETEALFCELRLDGTILFINPALEKVSGYTNEEVLGKNWWALFQKGLQYIEIQEFIANIKRNPFLGIEYEFYTKKGYKLIVKWDWVYKRDSDSTEEIIMGLGLQVRV
jgi:PAS domain S-box-containing protein